MLFILISGMIVLVDRLSKLWAVSRLQDGRSVPIIEGFLDLSYLENRGIAFGLFSSLTAILPYVALLIVVFLVVYYWRNRGRSLLFTLSLAFICGGALGNIVDRFLNHYVIDFIRLSFGSRTFPVFNLADVFVTLGTVLMVVRLLFFDQEEV